MSEGTEMVQRMLDEGFHLIPPYMHGGIARYVMKGVPPGDFLSLLLQNDFMGACHRADDENLHNLHNWARFFHNHVPRGCFGSPDNYAAWIARHGIEGMESHDVDD
jgi:hypothetical protein